MSHRDLTMLSYEEQVSELEQSDSLLRDQCSCYCPVIAYPNGSFTAETIAIAKRVYKAGFAVFWARPTELHPYAQISVENASVPEVAYLFY